MRAYEQQMLLNFIKEFIRQEGYSPSYREMAYFLGCSTSTVKTRLEELASQGYIKYVGNKARTVRVV